LILKILIKIISRFTYLNNLITAQYKTIKIFKLLDGNKFRKNFISCKFVRHECRVLHEKSTINKDKTAIQSINFDNY